MGPPASTENSQRKALAGVHFFFPGTTLASLRLRWRVQLRLQRKQWTALTELGHQFIHEMMQRIFMPEGRRRVCGADGELCGHRGKQRMERNSGSKSPMLLSVDGALYSLIPVLGHSSP